ncbi:MAG: sigma-70 family RNA polymerase sigma factor [Planctomycetaceae bacterium]
MSEASVDDRFRELLKQVRDGTPGAAETLVDEYGPCIRRAVRRRINAKLRDRYDSMDFAQSVWASFFGHLSVVSSFGSSGDLVGYLTRMASNKVIDAGRRTAARPERNSQGKPGHIESGFDYRRSFAEPTPSQNAVAKECRDLLTDQPQSTHRRMVEMKIAGASHQEIAAFAGVSERHVRRVLRRIVRKEFPTSGLSPYEGETQSEEHSTDDDSTDW